MEDNNQQIGNNILATLKSSSTPMQRMISLRQEFSSLYHRLLQSNGLPISFRLEEKHFPYLFAGQPMTLQSADLLLYLPGGHDPNAQNSQGNSTQFQLNGTPVNVFAPGSQAGVYPPGYWSANITNTFSLGLRNIDHVLMLDEAGILEATGTPPGTPAIDHQKLSDLFLVLTYTLT